MLLQPIRTKENFKDRIDSKSREHHNFRLQTLGHLVGVLQAALEMLVESELVVPGTVGLSPLCLESHGLRLKATYRLRIRGKA